MAKLLMAKGHTRVRSLQDGLNAWAAAGYCVQPLPSATDVSQGSAVQTAA